MTGRGRPLRFLALVIVGWIGARTVLLWPTAKSLPEAVRRALPIAHPKAVATPAAVAAPETPFTVPPTIPTGRRWPRIETVRRPAPMVIEVPVDPPLPASREPTLLPAAISPPLPAATQPDFPPAATRWSASSWLLIRPGSGVGVAPGGQLGGSQAGLRFVYMLDPRRRIALFGRAVSPLRGKGRELAVGVEWQPSRVPVRLVAEQRFPLDGGRPAPGLGLVAGDDRRILGFRLESYGQAGAIRRERIEPYADGAVRATRPLGRLPVALGIGAWGAAQRDARRLDIGPSATFALPLGPARIRVAVDWRQRVAGAARPGSGVALTLGSDF